MKRIRRFGVSLVLAGGLAVVAAVPARAVPPTGDFTQDLKNGVSDAVSEAAADTASIAFDNGGDGCGDMCYEPPCLGTEPDGYPYTYDC